MEYRTASLWLFCLTLGFSRAIDVITGRIRNHGHYVCSTWGNYHFKTFDGGFYQFPGVCSYNLASHCQDSYQEFSVHIHRSLVNGHPFIDKITITIKDVTLQIKSNLVVVNGAIARTPFYKFGILMHENDGYFKMYTKVGLTLMWNREDAIMVELDPRFLNHTCGLCGDYNGDPTKNEFLSGDKILSPINFGNQQNVNDPNEVCKDTDDTEIINPTHCSKYLSVCKEHLVQAVFSDCMNVLNLEAYTQACMIDMCSCDQSQDYFCLCSTISEYSRQCSHAGGHPRNWRTKNFCPKKCPANMVYQESASPCTNSCSHQEVHSLCEEHYMDGCFCPAGTVQDDYTGRGCLPVDECHCKHQGKLYAPGESIQNDCAKCDCVAGRWNCTDLPCPKVCSVEGGAHFTTFDGKTYTFHGNCYYALVKVRRDRNLILGKLMPCGSSERETCLQSVILVTDNLKNVVKLKSDGTVVHNDLKVMLPYITANFSILQPSKPYVIVQTAHGLQMQIQLLPKMQLYITKEKASKKQPQGLCGNFNSKEGDDFTTPGGLVEATASAFANTWKLLATCRDMSDWLDDPCSISIENKNYADYWCSKLENVESPFAKCHSTIDPTEYAKRCRYDSCSCKDSEHCMCAALSSYVRACATKGIILWGWKNGTCDKDITSCPSSQIYLYNLTTCQPTCRSLAEDEKACGSVFTPVDGCGCPDGQYLNEKDQCVHRSKCSCYYHDTYLKPREIISTKDKHCICQNGNLACNDKVNKTCPGGKVYLDCDKRQPLAPGAPIRRSCKTLSIEYFQTECISGCACPSGLLDDGAGDCVPEDRCPCVHNEDIYPHGSQVKVDCNTCFCQKGKWTCTNSGCYGTCTIYGNGHYISFDSKIYDFDGNCEFVAAQDYCEPDRSGGSFSVLTENIPCGTTGVTCSKSVKVFLGNTMLRLSEKHIVKTVGEGGKHVDYQTREVGIYLVIEASNGILLIWDKKTTIFIKVSPEYKGKLCGLCGNFDDNSQNDFKTRHMIQVVDVLEFGNSWKVDATCPDATDVLNPCSQNPHRHSWAEKQCGLIKSQVFKICHSKVDPIPFYEACVNDACSCDSGGDCECFCTAVAAYAQECTKAEACVYWRTPDICPIFCDYYNPKGECEWHYHPCGNHSVKTCRSINNIYTKVTITYLEGCYPTCPKDKPIFDEANKKCVTKEQCGCYVNEVHYKSGIEVPHYMNCHKCVCSSNGNIDCQKQACVYEKVCQWTQWLDVSKPGDDVGSGDYETYDEIRKHHVFCEVPEQIQCRAANAPNVNLDNLKQVVHCNVSYGLICKNSEQKLDDNLWQKCFNYEVQVECCQWICSESTPLTTTPSGISTSTTILETTTRSLDITSGSALFSFSITPELATQAQSCTPVCSWSEWFSVSYPTYESGGDYETYDNIRQAGHDVCERPLHISCRARHWPNKALDELQQKLTCDVSYGLICNNKEQNTAPVCFDYEVRVHCCRVPDRCLHTTPESSGHKSSTSLTTTTSSPGTNTNTTWTSKTTKLSETSSQTSISTPNKETSTSTHVTSSPTTTFGINIKTPRTTFKTTVKLPQGFEILQRIWHPLTYNESVHNTGRTTKKTTITSPASTSKAETIHIGPESTPTPTTEASFTTIISSPNTTPVTISPSTPPANTSFISPTTSTTASPLATSSTSRVIYTPEQMITTEGGTTSTVTSLPKTPSEYATSESVLTSATTVSATEYYTRILLRTDETSLTMEPNKATSTTSLPITVTTTTSLPTTVTTTALLTPSTTSQGTYTPTKSMPITSEATGTTNTFPYTTGEVTTVSKPTEITLTVETTTAGSTASPPTTGNVSPTISTTTSKRIQTSEPTSPSAMTTSSSTTASIDTTILTVSESVPASTTAATESTTVFPVTNKTTRVYTSKNFIETSPTKFTLSSTPWFPTSSSTPSHISPETTLYTHTIPGSSSNANTPNNRSPTITPTLTSKVTSRYISSVSVPYVSTKPDDTTATTTATTSYTSLTKLTTYKPTKTIPGSSFEPISTLTTEASSIGSSPSSTSGSRSHMPSTIQSTTESTIKSTIPYLTDISKLSMTTTTTSQETSTTGHTMRQTSTTTSSVITSLPEPTTAKETSISSSTTCVCMYNGTTYPPGKIISKVTNETWCHEIICSMKCKIEMNNWLCSTSPASTSIPALKSTSDTSPHFTSTSPQMASTTSSTTPLNASHSKTTPMFSSTTEKRGCSFEKYREPNETWRLDNCTLAKCLENHTVEIIELKCKSPPMITCANGYSPIAIPDEDQCCWHWECDCVCSGWGDPHYKTFDGTYYTFQGNCTYTLVEEIEKKNNFTVYLDNYDCGTKDLVSCPRNMIVLYNTQEIQLVVGGSQDTDIQVDVNGVMVGTPYQKYGVKIYTIGIYYVVEIPELGANITYNGLTFSVKLPYDRFGHNTQGQCGTCTNNRSDDCKTRDGDIVSKCEIMADSWIIEDPKKPGCGKFKTAVPPTVTSPSPTCQPSPLCSLIMGQTFQKCHKIVPPEDYHKACVYDSCHMSRSKIECSSLQHYAQLCVDKGICIDWRSQAPECSQKNIS
ncbi:mucin-2-like [Bufo gargarizans]|uniref:mucin-2-like n=1 Tax=Bufo gargarizans TaxID=30331 RepID=UPI001CF4FE44|nr:mucin-2-like [Bufo gargarizans]